MTGARVADHRVTLEDYVATWLAQQAPRWKPVGWSTAVVMTAATAGMFVTL